MEFIAHGGVNEPQISRLRFRFKEHRSKIIGDLGHNKLFGVILTDSFTWGFTILLRFQEAGCSALGSMRDNQVVKKEI